VCVSPNEGARGAGLSGLPRPYQGTVRKSSATILIQLMTTFKAVLTSFKAEGGNTYTVSLKMELPTATVSHGDVGTVQPTASTSEHFEPSSPVGSCNLRYGRGHFYPPPYPGTVG
jgi:hypothetical protein